MVRPDKEAAVQELSAQMTDSEAIVLTEYRGLSVAQLKDLRRSLGENASYAVTKNTLTKIAATRAGITGLDEQLSGPTAIAFIGGDVATVAKGLRDFAKDNPLLVLKGGVMDGRVLGAEDVKKLANLESREVLLAKLAGGMKGSLSRAVSLFAAPLSHAARALGALQTAAEANPDLIGGAGAASASSADAAAPTDATAEPAGEKPSAETAGDVPGAEPEGQVAEPAATEEPAAAVEPDAGPATDEPVAEPAADEPVAETSTTDDPAPAGTN